MLFGILWRGWVSAVFKELGGHASQVGDEGDELTRPEVGFNGVFRQSLGLAVLLQGRHLGTWTLRYIRISMDMWICMDKSWISLDTWISFFSTGSTYPKKISKLDIHEISNVIHVDLHISMYP